MFVKMDLRTEAAKQTDEVISRVKCCRVPVKPERYSARHNRRWRHK